MLSCFETSRSPHRTNPHSPFPSNISRRTVSIQRKDRCSTTSHLHSHRSKHLRSTPISTRSAQNLPRLPSPRRNPSLRTRFHLNQRYGMLRLVGLGTVPMAFPHLFRTPTNSYYVLTSKQCHHVTTTRSWLVQHPLVHGIAGSLRGY